MANNKLCIYDDGHYDAIEILQIIPAPDNLFGGFSSYFVDGDPIIDCYKVMCLALVKTTSALYGTKQLVDAMVVDEKGEFILCQKSPNFVGLRTFDGITMIRHQSSMDTEYDIRNWRREQ